jgi:hypothetical protein
MPACTVATLSHLPDARVLARSFLDCHPGGRFAALVVDDFEGTVGPDEPFEVLRPEDVGVERAELARMAVMYTPGALACALKPHVIRALLDEEPVTFLDADCIVFASLEPLFAAAAAHGTALTAHSLTPVPAAGAIPTETLFLRHGTFNSGVLACGTAGRPFLDWWSERTARHTVMSHPQGLSLDQSWLSLVPALFDHAIVRDPGVNVMGWNIHDRDILWTDGVPAVPGGPLRCFHFAGSFDAQRPERFGPAPTRREPWPPVAERPGVTRMCEEYAARLLAEGYGRHRSTPSAYDALPDGTPIDDVMREAYREALLAVESNGYDEPPNPFAGSTSADFRRWLAEPSVGRVGPYLARVRARRHDLRDAFPLVPGKDEQGLIDWAPTAAARGEIDLSWMPERR